MIGSVLMAKRSKKSYLEEFSETIGWKKFKSVADLEQSFNGWMRSMNYDFQTYGKNFSDSEFYAGADYTMSLLKKDKEQSTKKIQFAGKISLALSIICSIPVFLIIGYILYIYIG